jgi:hypothetical protein
MAVLIRSNGRIEIVLPKGDVFTLEELQGFVGGYIEAIYRIKGGLKEYGTFDVMIVNEEGKLQSLPRNLTATALYEFGDHDPIVGDVVLCKKEQDELL